MKTPTKKRKTKGKRHHVHAESLENIGNQIRVRCAGIVYADTLATIFKEEGKRLRAIIR